MTWKKGQSGNQSGRPAEKAFADAVRIAVTAEDPVTKKRKLRMIAERLVDKALEGEAWAIAQVADRLDGKPAQESTLTVSDKRDATDWTRDELVAILNDAAASRRRTDQAVGREPKSNKIH